MLEDLMALTKVQGIREDGHKVTIDDFGTGYSCFSESRTFMDCVKVDKYFIDKILHRDQENCCSQT